jgi:hypothetical protein
MGSDRRGHDQRDAIRSLKRQISNAVCRCARCPIGAREDRRERLSSLRDRLYTLTAGSSAKSLPDPAHLTPEAPIRPGSHLRALESAQQPAFTDPLLLRA